MRRFIVDTLLENWTFKITALVLALILWLIVRGDPGVERVITVPLEVRIPANMEITNGRPISVDVTLRGNFSSMWFGQGMPVCTIDLEGAEEGEHIVPLGADNVQLPRASGLDVLKVNPARVTLDVERTISKQVPVEAPIRGEPSNGFEVYGKTLSPATVVITGPRSHIEKTNEISTEPVSVAGQRQLVHAFVNLNIRDNMVRTATASPIEVNVPIGTNRRQFAVHQVPLLIDDKAYRAMPAHVSVQLLVPTTFKGKLGLSDLSATISVKGIDTAKLPAKVRPEVQLVTHLDPGIAIKEIWPPEVTLSSIH